MARNDPARGQQWHDEALQRAVFAIQNDLPAEAERIANGILLANAGHREASKILGYALMMLGRPREAIAPLERVARSSRDAECETQLAIGLRQCGRGDDALLWLKRAIKRTPPFPAAFRELGFVLKTFRRYDEAIEVLRQGIAAAPMVTELSVELGSVYQAKNDRPSAVRAYKQALEINPRHGAAIQGLGTALMDQRNFAEAAELYRRVVAENPGDMGARISLGNCLLSLGQADTAYACLRAASTKDAAHYNNVLKITSSSPRGRFWLRPSAAAKFFKGQAS